MKSKCIFFLLAKKNKNSIIPLWISNIHNGHKTSIKHKINRSLCKTDILGGETLKLTKGFEQAACIIVLLATQDPGIALSSQEINKRLKCSPTYLRKIIRKLVVSKLVNSVSGNNGGFTLATSAENINLLQVVEALEGPIETFSDTELISEVFKEFPFITDQGTAILKNAFAQADQLWRDSLKKKTVHQLIMEAVGEEKLSLYNWNQSAEKKELLIRKVMNSIHGND
jgi:Rrf2 family protein